MTGEKTTAEIVSDQASMMRYWILQFLTRCIKLRPFARFHLRVDIGGMHTVQVRLLRCHLQLSLELL
jgi:hypothetical protein